MKIKLRLRTQLKQVSELSDPPSWCQQFRQISTIDRYLATYWFWDHFDWSQQSIWIGKLLVTIELPEDNEDIKQKMCDWFIDLSSNGLTTDDVYLKLYFSRDIQTQNPEIHYILICNNTQIPQVFENTIIGQSFEKYRITHDLLQHNPKFMNLLDHYLNWSNFYVHYNLMEELEF